MNEKLKKIMDELANKFMECNHTGVDAQYCMCNLKEEDSFLEGFMAAIPHGREEILDLVEEICADESRELVEKELKKMDESNE